MTCGRRRQAPVRLAAGAVAVATLTMATVTSCAGSSSTGDSDAGKNAPKTSASATTGHATVGALTITGGYIPQPASPDVAAAYLTIANSGSEPDTITKITTDVTGSVMAMNETEHSGVGTMTALGAVTIPAHGRVSFTPGHAHLMLEQPTTRLRAGEDVRLTITFVHAGRVAFSLPVRPLTGTPTPSMSM